MMTYIVIGICIFLLIAVIYISAKPISMGEGNTPLLHSDFLSKKIGADVFIKVEGCNPSGSFKDRGMVVAVCMALHRKNKY